MLEHDQEAIQGRKITRIRPFLSCTECIRRKVKCDRAEPCHACKTRKKPGQCIYPPIPEKGESSRQRSLHRSSNSLDSDPAPPRSPSLVDISPSAVRKAKRRKEGHYGRSSLRGTNNHQEEAVEGQSLWHPWISTRTTVDRSDGQYTENTIKDMEDYLTAGAMSAKWTISAEGAEGPRRYTSPLSEGIVERLTYQKCIPSHRELYEKVIGVLPKRKEAVHCLVARYFSNVAWHWHILHRQSFLEEYEAFGVLFDRGEIAQVDPLWLANLFAVLTLAANSFDEVDGITGMFFDATELVALPDIFCRAAGSALECGDWLGKARIRSIQALSLLGTHLLFNAAPDSVERIGMYCITSMRMCQELGFHVLSDDPTKMPLSDPSFPQQPSLLKREIALRLFYNCVTLDLLQHRHRPFMDLSDITCGLPGNYNDDHLSFDSEDVPRPAPSLTETAIDILRFESAKMQREWLNLVKRDRPPGDQVLLDIDERILQIHTRYTLDQIDLRENRQMTWSKLISVYNLHVRRMRFHRPFVQSGQQSPTQDALKQAVENAARGLISAALELYRLGAPLVRGCFFLLHLQSAVVVLIQQAWHGDNLPVANADDELISNVIAVFRHYEGSLRTQVARAARIGATTIQLLVEALNDRRSFAGLHESFVHALKRISNTVRRGETVQDQLVGTLLASDNQVANQGVTQLDPGITFSDPALEAWMLSFMNISEGGNQIWDNRPAYQEGN
ncbi:uncharacterized protein L199_005687 [Kwoniella botswanensis]|uniref:uncharacterized protein n=1 Tax=Kwoniella botswanensis TaxID=1268659 RepID=UPI00315D0BEE